MPEHLLSRHQLPGWLAARCATTCDMAVVGVLPFGTRDQQKESWVTPAIPPFWAVVAPSPQAGAAALVRDISRTADVYLMCHVADDVGEAAVRGALEHAGLLGSSPGQVAPHRWDSAVRRGGGWLGGSCRQQWQWEVAVGRGAAVGTVVRWCHFM